MRTHAIVVQEHAIHLANCTFGGSHHTGMAALYMRETELDIVRRNATER